MTQTFPAPQDDQERPYTLLSIGGHALLLPQSEIRILAPVQDIKIMGQRASGVVGWLPFAGRRWPVYCLDEALHPLPHLPPGQRICALVKLNTSYFGLVCAHVAMVQGSALHIWPVPTAMTMPDSPLQGLSRHADRVALVSTAAALAVWLGVGDAAESTRQA
jgi:CheW-like protein